MRKLFMEKAYKTVKFGKTFPFPKMVVLMGMPGSGKSLAADYLNKKYGYTIVSGENISSALFENGKTDFTLVYKILRQLASKLLKENYSVVIDGTNLKHSFRKQIYEEVGEKIKPVLIYLLVDDKTAKERIGLRGTDTSNIQDIKSGCPEETFNKFKEQIEEPGDEEFCQRIVSDENLFREIDRIFSNL